MSWIITFIAAIALVFSVPIVNNIDAVKVIVDNIKEKFEQEVDIEELNSQLSEFFTRGSMEKNIHSTIPEFVFDISSEEPQEETTTAVGAKHNIPGLNFSEENFEVKFDEYTQTEPDEPDADLKTVLRKKLLKTASTKYLQSVETTKMLELASEVYVGPTFKVVSKNYSLKRNQVEGWTLVAKYPKDKDSTDSGTSIKLWVNDIDNETYCLAIAGTDDLKEIVTEYIPMETSQTYSPQQNEIAEFVNNIPKYIKESLVYSRCGFLKKLFVTGHSMGAFFAMTVGTDLYDSTPEDSLTLAKRNKVSEYLEPENIKAITFAAPGLLTEIPSDVPDWVKQLLGIGDAIPQWSINKHNNNKSGKYNRMLYQYTNNRDLVCRLSQNFSDAVNSIPKELRGAVEFVSKLNFVHLGNEYNFTSDKISVTEKVNFFKSNVFDLLNEGVAGFLKSGALVLDLEHHFPYQYDLAIRNNKCKLISKSTNSSNPSASTGTGGSTQR